MEDRRIMVVDDQPVIRESSWSPWSVWTGVDIYYTESASVDNHFTPTRQDSGV